MTERLIIRNFAGLEDIDIELGRINIFIGPQASGKSVCAKLLYWFKSFVPRLIDSSSAAKQKKEFDNAFLAQFKEYFPGIWRSDKGLLLRYELLDYFVQVENRAGRLYLTYDPRFVKAAITARNEFQAFEKNQLISPASSHDFIERFFWRPNAFNEISGLLYSQVGPFLDPTQLFILAGRSFFMAMKANMLSFLASTGPIADPFLRRFFVLYERARMMQPQETTKSKALLDLAHHILKGAIEITDEEDFVVSQDGRRIALANASSGQQEAFPLLVLLLNLVGIDEDTYPDAVREVAQVVYVEEPEAHLFPESQRALAQLMAQVYQQSPFHIQYVITTHSPYLLTSFNNLVYAHQLAEALRDQPAELKKLNKIIPKTQQLPLADFRAYGFENGKVKPLINQATGLLTADLIDSASDVTATQFDALLDLDPSLRA